jgi:hypothetical protein
VGGGREYARKGGSEGELAQLSRAFFVCLPTSVPSKYSDTILKLYQVTKAKQKEAKRTVASVLRVGEGGF